MFNVYRQGKNQPSTKTRVAENLTMKSCDGISVDLDTTYSVTVSKVKNGIEKESDDLLVYLSSEHEDSGYLIPQTRVEKGDWSSSTSDYQAVITADASWQATDYVIFALYSRSETIIPPSGITLLLSRKTASVSNAYLHVFGGVKGSSSSFTFNLSTATGDSCFGVISTAISNLDVIVDIQYKEEYGIYFTQDAKLGDSTGLYCVMINGFDTSARKVYKPTNPVFDAWTWSTTVGVRNAQLACSYVADSLNISKSCSFETTTQTNNAQAAIFFKRKAGVKPSITYNKTPLQTQISSSKGYAYAILKDGEIVETIVGGVEKTSGKAVTDDTVFQLASISKLITELAVRKLEEDGLLTLDDTIGQHLVGYTFGTNVASITIRNLLQMKSGVSASFDIFSTDWRQETRNWLANNASNTGKRFIYDNGCFAVIQLIIDAVVGDYIDYVQSNILKKIGIYDATHDATTLSIKNYSASYTEIDPVNLACTAAGGWCMSLKSFAKIAKTLRYSIILTGQKEMISDRYRMSPIMSSRGEMFQHDGLINAPVSSSGSRAQYVYGCDGYDVIALTNTHLSSTLIAACRNVLST